MKKLRKPVYLTAGYNTVSFGSGRKEFNPKKPRPGLEDYIKEAGQGTLAQIPDPDAVDEGVISNFMAARFNRQGNLAGLIPTIHPSLEYKPATRVEGACGSGGMGLVTAMKSVLAETADVVLALGVEVQNTVKAIYGADILAGAGHYASERKSGHAFFFPSKFSDRAGAYFARYGEEKTRRAMALWFAQMIQNARKNPKAQEYHNAAEDLVAVGMTCPNPKGFCEHINVFDCSKVSDGASAILFASKAGLKKLGVDRSQAIEVVGYGQSEANLTKPPEDLTVLATTRSAVEKALAMSGLKVSDIGVVEVHDCFTITGLLALESAGFVPAGQAPEFVEAGHIAPDGKLPVNATGGLIGFGHYTGGTGVRQAVDLLAQLTGRAGDCQARIDEDRRYGLMISMGGNDRTVSAFIFKPAS